MALFLAGSLVLKRPGCTGKSGFTRDSSATGRSQRQSQVPRSGSAGNRASAILASVSAVAMTRGQRRRERSTERLFVGLGIPFLIVGLALGRLSGVLSFVRSILSHHDLLGRSNGRVRSLLFTDKLTYVTSELESLMRRDRTGWTGNRR